MWTFVLFFIWNKSIDVKFGLSFKFMTCNNMFDVFVDIYDSFPIWSGCIDGQYSCMHCKIKMFVNESTSGIINFWNWANHQPSKFMLSFYGHLGLAFELMDLNQSLVIF